VDVVREKVLGRPPQRPAAPSPTGPAAYAQALLSRFNLPTATTPTAAAAPATDWFSTISAAVSAATSSGKSNDARAEELTASGNLFPREMASMSRVDKARFISNQRDLLDVLRAALVKEQSHLGGDEDTETEDLAYGVPLRKNRSENSFDHIEHEDVDASGGGRRTGGGGWGSGWFWGGESEGMRRRQQ
jgi:hypothetical protein